jgi:broad-specificity NMP kinase
MTFILAVTGPAGSGKSTVANKLAKQINKCVNIDADHVKHFIVSGFSYELKSDGTKKWDFNEWELVGDSIGLLARNFEQRGFNIVINGYINEPAWEAIQKHVSLTHKVLLLPHVDETKSRDKQRPGDAPMGEEAVQEHHDYFSSSPFYDDFVKLDTTDHSVQETVEEIEKLIKNI